MADADTSQNVKRQFRPDRSRTCENCGSTPIVPVSELCGPCHFGTADAVGGGWWDEGEDDFDDEFILDHM
jgi:hypothetical protein